MRAHLFSERDDDRETVNPAALLPAKIVAASLPSYIAKVRITVQADGTTIVREGHGSGEGRGTSPGEVHDIALKAAETDATKRAFATFGKPFGLELYRKKPYPKKFPPSASLAYRTYALWLSSRRHHTNPATVALLRPTTAAPITDLLRRDQANMVLALLRCAAVGPGLGSG